MFDIARIAFGFLLPCFAKSSGVWRRGEIGKGWGCNTWPRRPHSKHVWNIPSHNLLQTNYCTRNSRKNAIVLRPLRAIASHELLHELLRQQTTIAATPLAESTPSRELKITYHHHHPESKNRKSSKGNSGSIQAYGRYGNAGKTSKGISTIAILWPVKAIWVTTQW